VGGCLIVALDKPRMVKTANRGEIPLGGLTDRAYGIDQSSAIILIDKKGVVRAVPKPDQLNEAIEKLLAE